MNRRSTVGIVLAIFGLIIAGLGVFAIFRIMTRSFAPPAAPTPQPVLTELVVVTRQDLAIGDLLTPDNLRLAEVPVELIPRNAFYDIGDVTSRLTKIPLIAGEIILDHHIADPTNISHDLAFVIGDDAVLMAFPASDLMSGLDVLQQGDRVDILASFRQKIKAEVVDPESEDTETPTAQQVSQSDEEEDIEEIWITFNAMQAVEISAVIADVQYDTDTQTGVNVTDENLLAPDVRPVKISVRAYLLAVSPQDALVLKHLIDIGSVFDMVLRSPTSDQIFNIDPVILEYLIDRYGLEIPR